MKGTIKTVTSVGMFNGMHSLDVEFNHTQGEKIRFYSTRGLDDQSCVYRQGNEIEYMIKDNGGGKLMPPNKPQNNFSKPNNGSGRGASTNESILLQVCYKANMDVYAKDNRSVVEEYTKQDFNWMSNFLKSL